MKQFALAAFVALSLSAFTSPTAFADGPKSQNCAGATLGVSSYSLEASVNAISSFFSDAYDSVASIFISTDKQCMAFESQLNDATVKYVFGQSEMAGFEDEWNGLSAAGTAF